MSVQTEIDRLQAAKAELKSAIEEKGVTVPDAATLDGYGALVGQISQSGGNYVRLNIEDWSGNVYQAFLKTPEGYQVVPLYYGMPPLEVEVGSVAVFALVSSSNYMSVDVMVQQGGGVVLPDVYSEEAIFGKTVAFSKALLILSESTVRVVAAGGSGSEM